MILLRPFPAAGVLCQQKENTYSPFLSCFPNKKYFTIVSGGDERVLKPSLKAFDIVDNKEECVMIGDSINKDILPAIKVGMQAILITKKDIEENKDYKQIRKLEYLKEML